MGLLTVIYGPPLCGKTTLAWALARSLTGKTAVVSADQLLDGAIAVPDSDALAELEMAHTQLRLLVANYLKHRYHVVVEGPFYFQRHGVLHGRESDIDQLLALMRHLTEAALIVRLQASAETLAARARAAGRETELAAALRISSAYKARYGERFRSFDSGSLAPEAIAAAVRAALADRGFA